ncbi:MAG: trimeric intracellular cation channel family protein [Leptolyngbya sp. SIO3F4]|nr:trimeric intracellular cation channel family protein [Leptolyngbya sp. SIO3F4]
MIIYVLQLLGVAVSAVSGALAAGRKRLDLLGVVVVAAVSATGGGTLRDILLDRHPVFWIERPIYLSIILGSVLLTFVYVKFFKPPHKALLVADAFGLALFSISGAQIAEQVNLSNLLIVVMGTITGTAGGLLRDVLLADIPVIFTRSRIYATAAIVGICVYLLLQALGMVQSWAAILGMAVISSIRLAAIIWGLMLPIFTLSDEPPDN